MCVCVSRSVGGTSCCAATHTWSPIATLIEVFLSRLTRPLQIVAFVFLLSYKSAKSTAKGGGGETDFL